MTAICGRMHCTTSMFRCTFPTVLSLAAAARGTAPNPARALPHNPHSPRLGRQSRARAHGVRTVAFRDFTSGPQLPRPFWLLPHRRYYSAGIDSDASAEGGFGYHVSATFSAKNKKFRPTVDTYSFDRDAEDAYEEQCRLQRAAGQDAFFIASAGWDCGAVAVGVADGVGGYDEAGINSADFSQGLCSSISSEARWAKAVVHPVLLLAAGYHRVLNEGKVEGGASTASVGVFRRTGQFAAANSFGEKSLGDSGFVILRQGKVLYSSPPQTHYFNCPLQLAIVPKAVRATMDQFGGSPYSDSPASAQTTNHKLRNGDVVIFATDGVWDNLSNQGVLRIVCDEMVNAGGWEVSKDGIAPTEKMRTNADGVQGAIATAVVARAKEMSHNTKVDGPFAKEVQRLYPAEDYHGGKVDDICVVCTVVVQV